MVHSGPLLSRYLFINFVMIYNFRSFAFIIKINRSVWGKVRKPAKAVQRISVIKVSAKDEPFMSKCISSSTSPAILQYKHYLSSIQSMAQTRSTTQFESGSTQHRTAVTEWP